MVIEKDIGFCQAVRSGNTLYVSGVTGAGNMDSAVRSAYDQLKQILEANGLSPSNVVKETVFATDLDAFIQNRAIRKEFYGQTLPAASWVQVQRLYLPSFVVEVELTAEYLKGAPGASRSRQPRRAEQAHARDVRGRTRLSNGVSL